MQNWMNVKVKYAKEDEYGKLKNVTEHFLIDAINFIEAETRMHKELEGKIRGGHAVVAITKSPIQEVFQYDDTQKFFKVKVTYSTVDGDSAKEKKVTNYFLVEALDVKNAYERIHESLNNMLVSFDVPDILSSPVCEIFHFEPTFDKAAA